MKTTIATLFLSIQLLFFAAAPPSLAGTHPMDALSPDEIEAAVTIVKANAEVGRGAYYPIIRLVEMPKSEVLAWSEGDPISRSAEVQILSESGFQNATVDLSNEKLLEIETINDGRPLLSSREVFQAMGMIQADARWKEAIAKRGLADDSKVLALPFFRGYFGNEEDHDGHIYRMYAFYNDGQANYWGRPIGGLSAVVDLMNKKVLHVIDTGVVKLSDSKSDFNKESNRSLRSQMNPVMYDQKDGPSYKIDGNVVTFGEWKFHMRLEKQEGLVLSNITYRGRSVLYQAHVSELFVPYMDPTEHWYFRNFMDAGEGGLGETITPLMRGIDCPDNATLLSAVVPSSSGKGETRKEVIGLYERYCGDPSWRHLDPVTRASYGNRAQALVVRTISTVGNYDYAFDYVFDPSGGIKIRVGATGICSSKPVNSKNATEDTTGRDGAYGRFVDNYTIAVNHDHYIAYRLDFDVDGHTNRFTRDSLKPVQWDEGTPRTSGWIVDPNIAKTENDAKLKLTPSKPSMWRVMSSDKKNRHGYPTSYSIKPHGTTYTSHLNDNDWPQKRASWSKHNLFVTPYNAKERFASGWTPNQNRGVDGLAYWSAADRPIEDTDIVAWYNVGFHHVVRAEDWPVMPTAWHEFYLAPFDFEDRNPLMDEVE